jgi:PhzF family phenazine biosynthesis protein
VRILTPAREMLFAGHPTLGSCASWMRTGGKLKTAGVVKQECGIGIVSIDLSGAAPAFAAPRTTVAALPAYKLGAITNAPNITPDRIVRTAQLSNGPVWQVLELTSAADVLAADSSKIRYPEFLGVGLIGAHSQGSDCAFEVRMLAPSSGMNEDPPCGSAARDETENLRQNRHTSISHSRRCKARRGSRRAGGNRAVWGALMPCRRPALANA